MLQSYLTNRRANVTVMSAILAIPVIAGIGMALEYSSISSQRSKLQSATDAAALFAATVVAKKDALPSSEQVQDFIEGNYQGTISSSDVSMAMSATGVEITLKAESAAKAFFFGETFPDVFDLKVQAKTALPKKVFLEIVMVLDNTGSMEKNIYGDEIEAGDVGLAAVSKLDDLKVVSKLFINALGGARGARNDIKIGIVPFNKYVNVGAGNLTKNWIVDKTTPGYAWNGCVGSCADPNTYSDGHAISDPFPAFSASGCPEELIELTDVDADLIDAIDGMTAKNTTYIGEGVLWGLRVLSPQEPFRSGKVLGSRGATIDHRKIMLVLTDGDNTAAPNQPTDFYHDNFTAGLGDTGTENACTATRNAGVTIYTIAFGSEVSSAGESLMKTCADDVTRYYKADDANDLLDAFNHILADILNVRLTT